jgi:hypothetical protein
MQVAENRVNLAESPGVRLIVAEQTTVLITGTILNEQGAAIPAAGLDTLTATIYNRDSALREIVNEVEQVNILNTGRGEVHPSNGEITITLEPDDNTIIDDAEDSEWHRLLIEGTYASGQKAFKYEIDFEVRNLHKVNEGGDAP